MKKLRWWIISFAVILMYALYSGHSRASENEPIREPVYESPRVYTDSNNKVVFKEFFEGLTVNRIEFFDPGSGELLYGVSLQDGRLVGRREGSAVGENDGPFDESGEFVRHKYLTNNRKCVLGTKEYKGELVRYSLIGDGVAQPPTVTIKLKKGRIVRASRKFFLNNEIVEFERGFGSGTYREIYFHNDRSLIHREYNSGFLKIEAHRIPAEGGRKLTPYSAHYLRGKLAFTIKNKFNKENFREEIAIYDAHDKLVGKVNPVSGEKLYLKEEVVDGRKAFQVIRRWQDRQEKVEAMKFED